MDRRVRRTRRHLKRALLELIGERDYGEITVGDITERADVGRSTFYSHFPSKDDLLFSGFDAWLMSLADEVPEDDAEGERPHVTFGFSLPLLSHIRHQRRFFLALVSGRSSRRVRRRLDGLLLALVAREMERPGRDGPDYGEPGRAHAVVGAFLELAAWWLEEQPRLTPQEVDATFQSLWGAAQASD